MAIVALAATQQLDDAGVAQTYQTPNAVDTYTFPNDGRVFLHVKKSGAGICNVGVITPGTVRGKAIADASIAIPASTGDKMIGPFAPDLYNDANGLVSVTFSEVTGLSVAVVRL